MAWVKTVVAALVLSLLVAPCLAAQETGDAPAQIKYDVVMRQDISHALARRMAYRVLLQVKDMPTERAMRDLVQTIWKNGNQNWDEFTVWLYLPDMDTNSLAYVTAEFRPTGLKEFSVSSAALYGTRWHKKPKSANLKETIAKQERAKEKATKEDGAKTPAKPKGPPAHIARVLAYIGKHHAKEAARIRTVRANLNKRLNATETSDVSRKHIQEQLKQLDADSAGLVPSLYIYPLQGNWRTAMAGGYPGKRLPALSPTPQVGDVGRSDPRKIIQVIGPNDVLVKGWRKDEMLWIQGVSTTGLTDGGGLPMPGIYHISGTKQYDTAAGSTNTVLVLVPIDLKAYLP